MKQQRTFIDNMNQIPIFIGTTFSDKNIYLSTASTLQ